MALTAPTSMGNMKTISLRILGGLRASRHVVRLTELVLTNIRKCFWPLKLYHIYLAEAGDFPEWTPH